MKASHKTCLLNPGPVTLTSRVRQALLGPDLCHREPEFSALQTDVRARLERVYEGADDHAAILLTGSGTAAVEAMLGSLVPDAGRALVVANGVYGERMAAILHAQEKAFDTVRADWLSPMGLAEVGRRLRADARFTHVAAIHHETTTGRLNDLAALGAICRERGVSLLIDAVSSFGGERIDLGEWNVEGCAATANKCLHGVPGVAFVLVRRQALERPSAARGLYLDLHRNYEEQRKGGPLFTPAVQAMYALHEALAELEEQGGWRRRREHYEALSVALRAGLADLGFPPLLGDDAARSSFLSSFRLPSGLAFDDLWSPLKESGFVIYPGQQALQGAIFRVSVMGDLSQEDVARFIAAVAAVVRQRGV